MQVKKQQLELDMDWSSSSPFASKGLVPNWERSTSRLYIVTLLNFYAVPSAGLDESQAGIKISGENINNLRYADYLSNGRKQRGTKKPLDEGEGGE